MAYEIIYDETTDKYSMWSNTTHEFVVEDVTRKRAEQYLTEQSKKYHKLYDSPRGCIICTCDESNIKTGEYRIVCVGSKKPYC